MTTSNRKVRDAGSAGSHSEHGGRESGDEGAASDPLRGSPFEDSASALAERCEAIAAQLANERCSQATAYAISALRAAARAIRQASER